MMAPEIKKEIRRALIVCIPYFMVAFFRDDLDRFFFDMHSRVGNPLMALYMIGGGILISILFMVSAIDIREHFRSYGAVSILPLALYTFALLDSFWSPFNISSEMFHSPVVYKVIKREKYGNANLKMRYNGTLELRYPGLFGLADWEYGRWSERGDTFYLAFDRRQEVIDDDEPLADTMILSRGYLYPILMPADTVARYRDYLFHVPPVRAPRKKTY